jgi:hypothetical protein
MRELWPLNDSADIVIDWATGKVSAGTDSRATANGTRLIANAMTVAS